MGYMHLFLFTHILRFHTALSSLTLPYIRPHPPPALGIPPTFLQMRTMHESFVLNSFCMPLHLEYPTCVGQRLCRTAAQNCVVPHTTARNINPTSCAMHNKPMEPHRLMLMLRKYRVYSCAAAARHEPLVWLQHSGLPSRVPRPTPSATTACAPAVGVPRCSAPHRAAWSRSSQRRTRTMFSSWICKCCRMLRIFCEARVLRQLPFYVECLVCSTGRCHALE